MPIHAFRSRLVRIQPSETQPVRQGALVGLLSRSSRIQDEVSRIRDRDEADRIRGLAAGRDDKIDLLSPFHAVAGRGLVLEDRGGKHGAVDENGPLESRELT